MVIEREIPASLTSTSDGGQGHIVDLRQEAWSAAQSSPQKTGSDADKHQTTLTMVSPYDQCVTVKPHHLSERQQHWHPGNGEGSQAQTWRQHAREQEQKPLTTDAHGNYHAQSGDSMEGIARRSLRDSSHANPSHTELLQEERRIAEINQDRYPSLKDKPELLPPNAILRLKPGADDKDCKLSPGELPQMVTPGAIDHTATSGPPEKFMVLVIPQ
jgi:hypothetical protein